MNAAALARARQVMRDLWGVVGWLDFTAMVFVYTLGSEVSLTDLVGWT